ncbi:N-acyl homoserine lactonase family protein [Sphingomonas sabuli]|uniref:N-acyl homoserine lactonase family protein n=1 Tax=Sphingomonas sabuli TaxID=2764186 RepID=A0A7G9L288_9SPHN|nr:N-acyl homoserine lactonase family protein [Sphingomonas sabuli]QNM82737.1 N-acyl homoserine lactonase family protein [Sphingomonas sabuli]
MKRIAMAMLAGAAAMVAGCSVSQDGSNAAESNEVTPTAVDSSSAATPQLTLSRLDCGTIEFQDMNGFFSDRPGVYPPGPGKVTDSCYLIRHGDQMLLWDTGLPAATLQEPVQDNGMKGALTVSLADQLAKGGLKPADIDIVGISHMHSDHTGQAAEFSQARLLIGKRDFDQTAGKDDPFGPWRGAGKPVQAVSGETDIFGDGSVVALYLPGHSPDHLALRVNLASGPVLLTGDLYHSTIAREKRSLPGFNTSREQTLESMDKFEALAKQTGAKVVIQHEPADIGKVPAFPQAAK